MTLDRLGDYEDEADRLLAAYLADPDGQVPHPDGTGTWSRAEDVGYRFQVLSRDLRRKLWRDRARAAAVASFLDERAYRIGGRERLPRFEAVVVGTYSPPVM